MRDVGSDGQEREDGELKDSNQWSRPEEEEEDEDKEGGHKRKRQKIRSHRLASES